MKPYQLFIFIVAFFISCQPKKHYAELIVQEWKGKEIILPENIKYKVFGKDTLCSDVWDKSYKILTYFDSIGCIGCRLDLDQWKRFYDTCSIYQSSISLLLVVCSSDYTFLEQALTEYEFTHPIIYDEHDMFNKLNHFPQFPYQTFLLDESNKVQLIGSPINNLKMWELYKKIISSSN